MNVIKEIIEAPGNDDGKGDFTFTFSGNHTYDSNFEAATVTAKIFHASAEGRDITDDQDIVVVCVNVDEAD